MRWKKHFLRSLLVIFCEPMTSQDTIPCAHNCGFSRAPCNDSNHIKSSRITENGGRTNGFNIANYIQQVNTYFFFPPGFLYLSIPMSPFRSVCFVLHSASCQLSLNMKICYLLEAWSNYLVKWDHTISLFPFLQQIFLFLGSFMQLAYMMSGKVGYD